MIARLLLLIVAGATAAAQVPAVGGDLPEEVEAFVEARAGWLESFRMWAEGRGEAPFRRPARLRIPAGDPVIGGAEGAPLVRSARTPVVLKAADEAGLRDVLLGSQRAHGLATVRVKVVAVTPAGEGFDLELRVEAEAPEGGAAVDPTWQAVSRVNVSLRQTRAAGEEPAEWSCVGVSVAAWERASRTKDLFIERTLGVLSGDQRAAELLSVGMDRWAQRLDDPSRSAWFGHQGIAFRSIADRRPTSR